MNDDSMREKPYDFVPISDRAVDTQIAGHHRTMGTAREPLLSGTLHATIVSETYVSIGSGYVVSIDSLTEFSDIDADSLKRDQLIATHVRSGGRRIVPGSSLKGTIRSVVEAITSPGMHFTPSSPKERAIRGHRVFQITTIVRNQRLAKPPTLSSISLANRLFGLTSGGGGYKGHCAICDAPQTGGSGILFRRLPLYRPQPDYSEGDPSITTNWQRYFDNPRRNRFKGRKFYRSGKSQEVGSPYTAVEACTPDSTFTFLMHFDNLTKIELGVLLIALGAGEKIPRIKIGSGKPVSFGAIRFADLRVELVSPDTYLDFETITSSGSVDTYVQVALNSSEIYQPGLEKLAEIMTNPALFTSGGAERLY